MATATEKASSAIPGSENLPHLHENAIQRVSDYPVVKDTLSQAYTVIHSNSYSASAYTRVEALSASILNRLGPLQKRLPLETVDGYANGALDFVEKRFPVVKSDTNAFVQKVRKPADDAVGVAKTYADGIQSRLSPVTEQFHARLSQGQKTLEGLQARLSQAIASLPHDKASASEAINNIYHELESLSTYLATNAKELPAHAQQAAKPLVDGFAESLTHIRAEIMKKDVPITEKATNILSYSREKATPLLNSIVDAVLKKKGEVEAQVEANSNTVENAVDNGAKEVEKVTKKTEKKTKAKVNGST